MSEPLRIRPFGQQEVDLWDKKFVSVPATRSVHRRNAELNDELTKDGVDDDKSIELLAAMVDLRLKPAGQGRKRAGELIVEKWHADELSLPQLEELIDDLFAADRPT